MDHIFVGKKAFHRIVLKSEPWAMHGRLVIYQSSIPEIVADENKAC